MSNQLTAAQRAFRDLGAFIEALPFERRYPLLEESLARVASWFG